MKPECTRLSNTHTYTHTPTRTHLHTYTHTLTHPPPAPCRSFCQILTWTLKSDVLLPPPSPSDTKRALEREGGEEGERQRGLDMENSRGNAWVLPLSDGQNCGHVPHLKQRDFFARADPQPGPMWVISTRRNENHWNCDRFLKKPLGIFCCG